MDLAQELRDRGLAVARSADEDPDWGAFRVRAPFSPDIALDLVPLRVMNLGSRRREGPHAEPVEIDDVAADRQIREDLVNSGWTVSKRAGLLQASAALVPEEGCRQGVDDQSGGCALILERFVQGRNDLAGREEMAVAASDI